MIDTKDIDEALDGASIASDEADNEDLPEAPASANIKIWIDGFGVLFTMRDNQMRHVVNRVRHLIQLAKENGWSHTWDKTPITPNTPTTVAQKPPQDTCSHPEGSIKVIQVKKEGPNTGKYFKNCQLCGKFLGWAKIS